MSSEPALLAITQWMAEIPVTPPPHARSYGPSDASPLASPLASPMPSPLAPTPATHDLPSSPSSPMSDAHKHCFRVPGVSAHSSGWPDPEDLYYDLHLPTSLDKEDQEAQMTIAYACEERNSLQAELNLVSRRCRQMLFGAQTYAVRADKLNVKVDEVSQRIFTAIEGLSNKRHSQSYPGHKDEAKRTQYGMHPEQSKQFV